LFVPGSVTHVEMLWQHPRVSRFLTRIASFSRLILMDPRGLGMSDRLTEAPTLDERVADLIAVLDAAGSERANIFASSDSGPACIAAAVLHPERVSGLILLGTYAKGSWSEDYPLGATEAEWEDFRRFVKEDWGTERDSVASADLDEEFRQWLTALFRVGASPGAVLLLGEMTKSVDVRAMLPQVSAPTVVMHRVADRVNSPEHGRYLAQRIPNAQWVELPGDEFDLWAGDVDSIADEVEEFVTGGRGSSEPTRVVATVMFTDVVQSTERALAMGDRPWADLLEVHQARVRAELRRFGGREIDTAGDGFLAAFDSPTVAINCARAILSSEREIGIELRVGIHAGECELVGEKLRGIAVHIGARVAARAQPAEILVSQTVRDLLAGSVIAFEYRGAHQLKGVPGKWRLYSAV
jgi:class 3 adenylate cyclase